MTIDENQKTIFLNNIKTLKRMYKTNAEFFNEIGIDESAFSLWVNGRRRPRFNTIYDICKKLGVDIYDMLNKKLKIKIVCEFEKLTGGEDDESITKEHD